MYSPFVVEEKGVQDLYVELFKALYGTLKKTQLFWKKLHEKLIHEWIFTPNKNDECVVLKMVGGSK